MRWTKRTLLMACRPILDPILALLLIPCAYILHFYRRVGARVFPITTSTLQSIGVYPVINHYYEPLVDGRKLSRQLGAVRNLAALDLNEQAQLELLSRLCFAAELRDYRFDSNDGATTTFDINNASFASGDAEFLYQFIRHFKPSSVVEIGSGNSTKIARLALERNQRETGQPSRHICVEPFEQSWLEQLDGIELIRTRVEDLDSDWANLLQAGDLLFIDSSHIIRPQGDVLKEYLEIIPELTAGVFVHVHDIFTPRDYLDEWITRDVRFWNEQYLLEALLMNKARYEVVAAVNFLKHQHFSVLQSLCPYLTKDREPGSFYFRVK